MDKLTLGFIAEILYIKKVISIDEMEAIHDLRSVTEFDKLIEDMLTEKFKTGKRGEGYEGYGK